MAQYELSEEQVTILKRAINHELNDNSFCMGLPDPSTKKRLTEERKVLSGLYDMLSRRQASAVDKVEGNTVSNE